MPNKTTSTDTVRTPITKTIAKCNTCKKNGAQSIVGTVLTQVNTITPTEFPGTQKAIQGLPTLKELTNSPLQHVFHASPKCVSKWRSMPSDKYGQPSQWDELVAHLSPENEDGSPLHASDMPTLRGEYNRVYLPKSDTTSLPIPLSDAEGHILPPSSVALRITRTFATKPLKVSKSPDEDEHQYVRYKSLNNAVRELRYTLHAAAMGFAPAIHAAFLFAAPSSPKRYGALYVMTRGICSVSHFLDQYATAYVDAPDDIETKARILRKVGRCTFRAMLPLLLEQSKAGIVSFDAKPHNFLINGNSQVHAIDFDAAMYVIRNPARYMNDTEWKANLLVHLALIGAHLKCFFAFPFAQGWAEASRELLLSLVKTARGTSWPFAAKLKQIDDFRELLSATDISCTERLEMMVALYFVRTPNDSGCQPLVPQKGTRCASLLQQLLYYVLHDCSMADGKKDVALDAAFGISSDQGVCYLV